MARGRRSGVLSACAAAVFVAAFSREAFVGLSSGSRAQATAMHGFKEDFQAWRSTLSTEEKALLSKQSGGEFDKKFRKTAEFSQRLPEDKEDAFGKILEKYLEAEVKEDEKARKIKLQRTIDGDALRAKTARANYNFGLKFRMEEIDRMAERKYYSAVDRETLGKEIGQPFPATATYNDTFAIQNNDTESHQNNKAMLEALQKMEGSADFKKEVGAMAVPAMGEKWTVDVTMGQRLATEELQTLMAKWVEEAPEAAGIDEETLQKLYLEMATKVAADVSEAQKLITDDAVALRDLFRSEEKLPGKTKADVAKTIHEVMTEVAKKTGAEPPAPLEADRLAELAKKPANDPEKPYKFNWGTADTLWKSVAVDSFGSKYLLGVFDTEKEAKTAFDNWNEEYEKAWAEKEERSAQWAKKERARLDKDTSAKERIQAVIAESAA